jgi:hypothetical protein
VSSRAEAYLEFGLTPAQYHGQLDRLWEALGVTKGPNGEDVFTLAIKAIEQARCKVSGIEGIPDGWELVRVGKLMPGDYWLDGNGLVARWDFPHRSAEGNYAIIRKIEKPPQYRAFANGAEFKPHRDRWLARVDESGLRIDGEFQHDGFDNTGIWLGSNHLSYKDALGRGHTFDDGSPFGVEVTP